MSLTQETSQEMVRSGPNLSKESQESSATLSSTSSTRSLRLDRPHIHYRDFKQGFVRYTDVLRVMDENDQVIGTIKRRDILPDGLPDSKPAPCRRSYSYGHFHPDDFECNDASIHTSECRARSVFRRGRCHCPVPIGEEHERKWSLPFLQALSTLGFR